MFLMRNVAGSGYQRTVLGRQETVNTLFIPGPPLKVENDKQGLVFHGGVPRSSLQRGDGKWACERGRVSARLVKRSGNPTTNCHN